MYHLPLKNDAIHFWVNCEVHLTQHSSSLNHSQSPDKPGPHRELQGPSSNLIQFSKPGRTVGVKIKNLENLVMLSVMAYDLSLLDVAHLALGQ